MAINNELQITVDEYSIAGRKEVNQDFHGVSIPKKPLLTSKGITIALADGISSSQVSQIASETAVRNFLEDYYHTSETWSVKKSGIQVVNAVNSWLYSQTQKTTLRLDKNKGYVCTLSAMVMKSNKAHIFHVGDSRIYRLRDKALEVLTEEHRVWLSEDKSYLGRGVGINQQVDIDYHSVDLKEGDVFLFMTDGIYEFVSPELMCQLVEKNKNDIYRTKFIDYF